MKTTVLSVGLLALGLSASAQDDGSGGLAAPIGAEIGRQVNATLKPQAAQEAKTMGAGADPRLKSDFAAKDAQTKVSGTLVAQTDGVLVYRSQDSGGGNNVWTAVVNQIVVMSPAQAAADKDLRAGPNARVDSFQVFRDNPGIYRLARYPSAPVRLAARPVDTSWCFAQDHPAAYRVAFVGDQSERDRRGVMAIECSSPRAFAPFLWWGLDDQGPLDGGTHDEIEARLLKIFPPKE